MYLKLREDTIRHDPDLLRRYRWHPLREHGDRRGWQRERGGERERGRGEKRSSRGDRRRFKMKVTKKKKERGERACRDRKGKVAGRPMGMYRDRWLDRPTGRQTASLTERARARARE